MSQMTLTFDASILERVVSPEEPSLAAEAARAMLLFAFPERDRVRMHELSEKARQGALTPDERPRPIAMNESGAYWGCCNRKLG